MINIIVCIARNRAIGLNNRLLYRLRADMRRFKQLTTGHTVLMGRRTFESLPKGALPNRRNIVLTRSSDARFPGCEVYSSLNEALSHTLPNEEVFVIGGASVYAEALPIARRLYLTCVDNTPAQADTFFPEWNEEEWTCLSRENFPADESNEQPYSFVLLERR